MHLVALLLALAGAIPDGAFVRVDGAGFVVGDKPFAFVGANLDVMHGADERARAAETIAAARADGLTVGRVWALGEGDATLAAVGARTTSCGASGPTLWLDGGPRQLDRVLAEARAHGLRVIVTLSNYWDDFGGIRQYLALGQAADRHLRRARSLLLRRQDARVLPRAPGAPVVDRVNSVTGVRYVDDPTIFAWELMNESRGG